MAKGSESKQKIFEKIIEMFPNSFWETQDKILRVPMNEDGAEVQIKVQLTAAKENIGGDSGFNDANGSAEGSVAKPIAPVVEPSAEEIAKVNELMAKLNL